MDKDKGNDLLDKDSTCLVGFNINGVKKHFAIEFNEHQLYTIDEIYKLFENLSCAAYRYIERNNLLK